MIFIAQITFHLFNEFLSIWSTFICMINFRPIDTLSSHQYYLKLVNFHNGDITLMNSHSIFDESFSKIKLLNRFHQNGWINSQEKMHPLTIHQFINVNDFIYIIRSKISLSLNLNLNCDWAWLNSAPACFPTNPHSHQQRMTNKL